MKKVIVNRIFSNEHKTLSDFEIVEDNKTLFACKGIELPWKNNIRGKSCIPAGIYCGLATRRASSGAYALWIDPVPGRSEIMVHTANYARDLLGCLAPGEAFSDIDRDGIMDVTNSRKMMVEIEKHLPINTRFEYHVIDTWRVYGNAEI